MNTSFLIMAIIIAVLSTLLICSVFILIYTHKHKSNKESTNIPIAVTETTNEISNEPVMEVYPQKILLPSLPSQIQNSTDLRFYISRIQRATSNKCIQSLLETESYIMNSIQDCSVTMVESHFDTLLYQYEIQQQNNNLDEIIKENFLCTFKSLIFSLDICHHLDMISLTDEEWENRKQILLDANNYVSNRMKQIICVASGMIKDQILATIEHAKVAGCTSLMVVDEFGHDIELLLNGGLTNICLKDFNFTNTIERNNTTNTETIKTNLASTTDDIAKDKMAQMSEKREQILNQNRGNITANAKAFIDEWARNTETIINNSTVFDENKIEKRFEERRQNREKLIKGLLKKRRLKQKIKECEYKYRHTIFRLFYKLDINSDIIGRSNLIRNTIETYMAVANEKGQQYLKYVANKFSKNPDRRIKKPNNYSTIVELIMSSNSVAFASAITVPGLALPIIIKAILKIFR